MSLLIFREREKDKIDTSTREEQRHLAATCTLLLGMEPAARACAVTGVEPAPLGSWGGTRLLSHSCRPRHPCSMALAGVCTLLPSFTAVGFGHYKRIERRRKSAQIILNFNKPKEAR